MTAVAAQRYPAHADDVLDRSDARWLRLREIIRAHSLKRGNFVLSSGRTSTYLFQLRQTTMLPEGAALLGEIILEYMNRRSIRCIGGLEMGAVPLVSSVAVVSHFNHLQVDAFFVRKEPKKHGACELIDGHLSPGAEVLMVDDVATSGGSFLLAVDSMMKDLRSFNVHRALVVVDREEGAAENLAAHDIQLAAIFKRSDFPEI